MLSRKGSLRDFLRKGGPALAVKRRRFTREFKLQVVRDVKSGKPIARAAREYLLHPIMIGR